MYKPYKFQFEARFRKGTSEVIRLYCGRTMNAVQEMLMRDVSNYGMPDVFYGKDGNGYENGVWSL